VDQRNTEGDRKKLDIDGGLGFVSSSLPCRRLAFQLNFCNSGHGHSQSGGVSSGCSVPVSALSAHSRSLWGLFTWRDPPTLRGRERPKVPRALRARRPVFLKYLCCLSPRRSPGIPFPSSFFPSILSFELWIQQVMGPGSSEPLLRSLIQKS